MLVTASAVEFLSLDLVFGFQVRFVDVGDFFSKLDLLGLELVIRLTVAGRGGAVGIAYSGTGAHAGAAKLNVRKALGRLLRNMDSRVCF